MTVDEIKQMTPCNYRKLVKIQQSDVVKMFERAFSLKCHVEKVIHLSNDTLYCRTILTLGSA